jgi:hypothetical protein
VTGVVRDDRGQPIAGTKVTSWGTPSFTIETDDAGRFDVAVGTLGPVSVVYLTADKAGYEPDAQYTNVGTRDLVLHDITRIRLGASIEVTLGPDDALWGVVDYEYRSRIVRVNPAGALTMLLELLPDGVKPVGLLTVPGRNCCSSRERVNVSSGADVPVRILIPLDADTNRTFTLVTSAVS